MLKLLKIGASLPFVASGLGVGLLVGLTSVGGGSFIDARLDPGVGADDYDGPHRSSLCGRGQGRGDAKPRIGENRGLEDPSAVGLRQCAGNRQV